MLTQNGRLIAAVSLVAMFLAGCGESPTPEDATVSSTTTTSTTESAPTERPTAPCTTAAVEAVVRPELDPDGTIPGSVEVAECQNGYARVFYRPDAQNFETEQLFLRADSGQWAILTYGTGIDCATDTDFQPAELEDACEALGLRR